MQRRELAVQGGFTCWAWAMPDARQAEIAAIAIGPGFFIRMSAGRVRPARDAVGGSRLIGEDRFDFFDQPMLDLETLGQMDGDRPCRRRAGWGRVAGGAAAVDLEAQERIVDQLVA